MKKFLIIFLLFYCCYISSAQSQTLYVVFQVNVDKENSIEHGTLKNYDTDFYRYQPHFIVVSQAGLVRSLLYANLFSQPDEPIKIQPVSFLDSVEFMDWNTEIMNYSGAQFYEFLDKLRSYDKVYFIDRSEINDGMMKMYPVKEVRAGY